MALLGHSKLIPEIYGSSRFVIVRSGIINLTLAHQFSRGPRGRDRSFWKTPSDRNQPKIFNAQTNYKPNASFYVVSTLPADVRPPEFACTSADIVVTKLDSYINLLDWGSKSYNHPLFHDKSLSRASRRRVNYFSMSETANLTPPCHCGWLYANKKLRTEFRNRHRRFRASPSIFRTTWRTQYFTLNTTGKWKHFNTCDVIIMTSVERHFQWIPTEIYQWHIGNGFQIARHTTWLPPWKQCETHFLNENIWFSIKMSLKFAPMYPIDETSTLVYLMACQRTSDNFYSKAMTA